MGIFRNALDWSLRAMKWGSIPMRDPALSAFFGPIDTSSGVPVNEYTAFNCSAVFAAVRLISEAVGQLDCVVMEKSGSPGNMTLTEATDHRLWSLVHDRPNPEMNPISFWATLQAHVLTWGNAYAEIVRDGAGRPAQLWPIPPNRVRPRRILADRPSDRKIVYDVFPNVSTQYALQSLPIPKGNEIATIPYTDMLHIHGLGFDGLMGYSVVTMARESIGLTMATEQFGAGFFGRGSRPTGVLTHPGRMKDEGRKNLREQWERTYQGLNNAHRVALLEEGVKWEAIGIPPEDAQFLQTRKFQLSEIARWFNVPPHMLRDLDRATFSNIEEQGMDFVTYSLRPWLVRHIQEVRWKCLTDAERSRLVIRFLYEILQRGNFQNRMQAYHAGIQDGIFCPDEVREMEGMNHRPDGLGKVFLRPLNMVPADTPVEDPNSQPDPAQTPEPTPDPQPEPDADKAAKARKARKAAKKAKQAGQRAALIAAQRQIVLEAAQRMVSVEATAIRRAAKDPSKFLPAVTEFYGRYESMLRAALVPALRAHLVLLEAQEPPETVAEARSREHVAASREAVLSAAECTADKLLDTIDTLCKRWEAERPGKLADTIISEELTHAIAC